MTPRCESCGTNWRKHLGIQGTCAKLREAEQKIERLQAIVDRLPTTANGVPMVIGDSVFLSETQTLVVVGAMAVVSTGEVIWAESVSCVWRHGWESHSTREAAEKARATCNE